MCETPDDLHFLRVLNTLLQNTLLQAGPAQPETRAGRCFSMEHDGGGANFTYASKTRVTWKCQDK